MIVFLMIGCILTAAALILLLQKRQRLMDEYNLAHPEPDYVIQKEWDNAQAKYHYVLYHNTVWSESWGIYAGYRAIGSGNKEWAEIQAKHYKLEI